MCECVCELSMTTTTTTAAATTKQGDDATIACARISCVLCVCVYVHDPGPTRYFWIHSCDASSEQCVIVVVVVSIVRACREGFKMVDASRCRARRRSARVDSKNIHSLYHHSRTGCVYAWPACHREQASRIKRSTQPNEKSLCAQNGEVVVGGSFTMSKLISRLLASCDDRVKHIKYVIIFCIYTTIAISAPLPIHKEIIATRRQRCIQFINAQLSYCRSH